MSKLPSSHQASSLAASAMVLAAITAVYGQDPAKPASTTPASEPEKSGLGKFFSDDVPAWIKDGKFSLNARLRYEYADTTTTSESHAPTLRTRFGYTTGVYHGFQGMVEGENISVIGDENNALYPGNPANGKTVVADPATTELNQFWLSYSNWDTTIKGPRQRIVLDNHRFIGDVGWRQNQQTYDGVLLENKSIKDVTLTYAYLAQVNRVFGTENSATVGSANAAIKGRWQMESHVINGKWAGSPYANVLGYAYLLDIDTAPVNSTATYGGSVSGTAKLAEDVSLGYRGELAWQTDYGNSPLSYSAPYYHLNATGTLFKRFTVGAGYEVLGSDNNQGFRTPLATLHAFNGWADVFLTTPAQGLRDLYGVLGVTLPGDVPLQFVYHKFDSDKMSQDYGSEFDVVISKKFYKNWTAMLKYAHYMGEDAPYAFDVDKFWAQVEFNF
ncbi:MAG TPA: hypothetical protein DCY13_13030 [Verrucomicrobiales bacterium]|nr:hypothetical protein [Verrucomicrobiales bacterium]